MAFYGNAYSNGGFPPGYPTPYAGYVPPPTFQPGQPMQTPAPQPANQQTGQAVQQNPAQPQQPYQQPQVWQPQQQVIFPQGIPWVTRQEAENYNPPPGSVTALWVRDENTIFLKSLDNLGKPYTQILRYTEEAQEPRQNIPVSAPESREDKHTDYALKSDLNALQSDLNTLRDKIQPVITMIEKQAAHANGKDEGNV